MTAGLDGDLELGADAVRGGNQDRIVKAGGLEVEKAPKPPSPASRRGGAVALANGLMPPPARSPRRYRPRHRDSCGCLWRPPWRWAIKRPSRKILDPRRIAMILRATFALILCLFAGLAGAPAGSNAQTAGIVAVRGIDVDVTAGNAVDARKGRAAGPAQGPAPGAADAGPGRRCGPYPAPQRQPDHRSGGRLRGRIRANLHRALYRQARLPLPGRWPELAIAAERGFRQCGTEPAGVGAACPGRGRQEPALGGRQFLARCLESPSPSSGLVELEIAQGRCN